ncbi:hypothetical protein COO60DRAFT_1196647 [Scenedesmus sp. NREL 46B-D3]|nr:hypothetical protein COO60DRAFT_1196647 [Scenedesmus sp. NREL 46B-D3]
MAPTPAAGCGCVARQKCPTRNDRAAAAQRCLCMPVLSRACLQRLSEQRLQSIAGTRLSPALFGEHWAEAATAPAACLLLCLQSEQPPLSCPCFNQACKHALQRLADVYNMWPYNRSLVALRGSDYLQSYITMRDMHEKLQASRWRHGTWLRRSPLQGRLSGKLMHVLVACPCQERNPCALIVVTERVGARLCPAVRATGCSAATSISSVGLNAVTMALVGA